jgi:CHAD domain-containing protein
LRFVVVGRVDAARIGAWLAPTWRVTAERTAPLVQQYLDTFDWALWRSRGRLVLEREGDQSRMRWQPGVAKQARMVPLAKEVRFARDLPGGVLRREVAAAAGLRALLPVGEMRVRRRLLRVVDGEGKTLVRLWLEAVHPLLRGGPAGPARTRVRVEPLVGYARAAARVVARLQGQAELAPDERDDLADAAAVTGRPPGDYSSKVSVELVPDQPAEVAVRRILTHLLATLRANVEGTVLDLDSEFLHDLRVATRRTRTCLGQLRGVLPAAKVEPFGEEFRWLAALTTPCRDLDVFLVELQDRRGPLPASAAAALEPLLAHLRKTRAGAHEDLAKALRSARFEALLERWGKLLSRPARGGRDGALPIARVAKGCVLRAYRRFARHGRALGPVPQVQAMHRLRIDAKKLRYLLEFFASLWEAEESAEFVAQLKLVQDALGTYHDAWLQHGRLIALGDEILAAGAGAGTLLAMGRLIADLERRQAREAESFFRLFAEFTARPARARLTRLVERAGVA